MTKFVYDAWIKEELNRVLRGLFDPGISLKVATLREDYGGIDLHYIVNHNCPLQVRCRFNRPAGSADCDITFRTTEPAMMTARTYAPLMVVAWFQEHHVIAAKLIDIYRMHEQLDPPLAQRAAIANGDGTAFVPVAISDLHTVRAYLRVYDGRVWATEIMGGEARLNRILRDFTEVAVAAK